MAQPQLKATLKVLYGEEEDFIENSDDCKIFKTPTFHIKFVTSCGVVIKISIEEPYMFGNNKWQRLLNEENIIMNFCSSNGEVSIACDTQLVFFNVAKYGAGGDGDISVRVPHSDIKEILSEMVEEIEKYVKQYIN